MKVSNISRLLGGYFKKLQIYKVNKTCSHEARLKLQLHDIDFLKLQYIRCILLTRDKVKQKQFATFNLYFYRFWVRLPISFLATLSSLLC